jgi:DNA (cytosine-5)-methyltransferase 1
MPTETAAELFCGMGMSALGLVEAGFDLIDAVDAAGAPVAAFNAQPGLLPPVARVGWVGQGLAVGRVDLLSGGPVCKAFSPGARLFGTKGRADRRNTFPVFFAEVDRYRPPYVLIENTFGLARFTGYMNEMLSALDELGYDVEWQEVDAFHFGVPQHRRRLIFLCTRRGYPDWEFFVPAARLPGPEVVGDVLSPPPPGDPWPLVLPMTDAGYAYFTRDPRHARKHRPLTVDRPAPAVVSNYSRGVPYGVIEIGGELGLVGPRLAARLQGLPDEYDLSAFAKTPALRAIGNGVPSQVNRWFGEVLRSAT